MRIGHFCAVKVLTVIKNQSVSIKIMQKTGSILQNFCSEIENSDRNFQYNVTYIESFTEYFQYNG